MEVEILDGPQPEMGLRVINLSALVKAQLLEEITKTSFIILRGATYELALRNNLEVETLVVTQPEMVLLERHVFNLQAIMCLLSRT